VRFEKNLGYVLGFLNFVKTKLVVYNINLQNALFELKNLITDSNQTKFTEVYYV